MRSHLLEFERFSKLAFARLASLGNISVGEDWDSLSLAEIIFVRLGTVIDKEFLSTKAPNIKYILSPTTGLDHLDLDYINAKGITLISLKGEFDFLSTIPSTAEHTWGLLLALFRKIPQAVAHVEDGNWDRNFFIGNNLFGKKIGILGLGRVGKQIANYAKAFGMEIHAFDISDVGFLDHIILHPDYESFAKSIDVLSIHIPMNPKNRNWLNKDRINLLPEGIKIVNTSRGGIWDEEELAIQIKRGKIAGLATDVLADELNPEKLSVSPLIVCQKLGFPILITPHIAGACIESMHATEEFVVRKLFDFIGS